MHGATRKWIAALADLGVEAGLPRKEAKRRAQIAFVRIQGGLVLARATSDRQPFRHALATLPTLFDEEATPL